MYTKELAEHVPHYCRKQALKTWQPSRHPDDCLQKHGRSQQAHASRGLPDSPGQACGRSPAIPWPRWRWQCSEGQCGCSLLPVCLQRPSCSHIQPVCLPLMLCWFAHVMAEMSQGWALSRSQPCMCITCSFVGIRAVQSRRSSCDASARAAKRGSMQAPIVYGCQAWDASEMLKVWFCSCWLSRPATLFPRYDRMMHWE